MGILNISPITLTKSPDNVRIKTPEKILLDFSGAWVIIDLDVDVRMTYPLCQ